MLCVIKPRINYYSKSLTSFTLKRYRLVQCEYVREIENNEFQYFKAETLLNLELCHTWNRIIRDIGCV